jgi:TPR repeat protein
MILYANHLEYTETPDLEKSFNYIKKGADSEDAFAMTELGYFYIFEKGVTKNPSEANK